MNNQKTHLRKLIDIPKIIVPKLKIIAIQQGYDDLKKYIENLLLEVVMQDEEGKKST